MPKLSKNTLSRPFIVILLVVIALLLLILVVNSGVLNFYLNGTGLKKAVITTYSRVVLWNTPEELKGNLNKVTGNHEITISHDRKLMFISRFYDINNKDIFFSKCIDGKWTKPERLANVNSDYNEITPSLSDDGKYLFFASDRPGGKGGFDIWVSESQKGVWQTPYLISNGVNTEFDEKYPYLSIDKQVFYFNSNRPEEVLDNPRLDSRQKDFDIYSLFIENIFENEDASTYFKFRTLKKLNSINSKFDEGKLTVTARGNIIYFTSNRPGGLGGYDIYRTYLLNEGYTEPENLGDIINSTGNEICPIISDDGYEIYYETNKFSWDKSDYTILNSNSAEVVKKFDSSLLINFISIVLLLLIVILVIFFLLRMLAKKTDMSLLVKCLIIALIIHLLLALLSGIWYLGSQVSEVVKDKYNDITININTLARESVALSVREGVASLPKVKAVSTTNKPVEKVTVPQQKPISSSEVSEKWQEADVVKPASSPVNVQKTVHSEKTVQYTSDNKISEVKPLKFGSSQIAMEVPEGTGEQASAETIGSASGLPKAVKPVNPVKKEKLVELKEIVKPTIADITPTSLVENSNIKNINKTLDKSINTENAVTSPTVEHSFASSQDIDGLFEDVSDFAGDDREVDGMMGAEGGFFIDSSFVMQTPTSQPAERITDFTYLKEDNNYSHKKHQKYSYTDLENLESINLYFVEYTKKLLGFKAFESKVTIPERYFSETVGNMIYEKTPKFIIELDTELEVPESYLLK